MSAPGVVHAQLEQLLTDLATLSRFIDPLDLGGGLTPDLARAGHAGARMVGDAKSTEGPGDIASQDRLAAYVRRLAGSPRSVLDHLVVACPTASDATAWADVLEVLARRRGLRVLARRVDTFGSHEHVGRIAVTSVPTFPPALDERAAGT